MHKSFIFLSAKCQNNVLCRPASPHAWINATIMTTTEIPVINPEEVYVCIPQQLSKAKSTNPPILVAIVV